MVLESAIAAVVVMESAVAMVVVVEAAVRRLLWLWRWR